MLTSDFGTLTPGRTLTGLIIGGEVPSITTRKLVTVATKISSQKFVPSGADGATLQTAVLHVELAADPEL